jgi:outer membrane protein
MTRRFAYLLAGAAAAGALASAGSVFAQASSTPSAAISNGPVIPGVCIFSNEQAIAESAVGKYVAQRMQQLQAQATAEVNGEKTGIETDAKALEAQRATLSADTLQQRATALNQRAQALQRKADQRSRELQATEQKALGRIATEMTPLLRTVYGQHNCGLLLDRNAVFGANPSMDTTAEVLKLLDAKITQFPFDRERLDQPTPAAK